MSAGSTGRTGQETEEAARSQGAEEAERDWLAQEVRAKGWRFILTIRSHHGDLKTPVENMVELNIKSYNRERTEWQPLTYLVRGTGADGGQNVHSARG